MPNPVIDFPWTYCHVTATTDPEVLTGPGVLHTIVNNGITVNGVATVYDGIDNTGTVIAVIVLSGANPQVSCQPITLLYDVEVTVGIHIQFDDTLAADLTVTYH